MTSEKEPSASEKLRAATSSLRSKLDSLARGLDLDPAEEKVRMAQAEALRLLRLFPRSPDSKRILNQLLEAAHMMLDAEAGLAKTKMKGTKK